MIISQIQEKTLPIFNEYGISYAGVFGSVSRGEERQDSDVDLLVRFSKPMGMFSYMKFIRSLESAIGRKVDVVTDKSLNKFVRPFVEKEIKTIYEKR